MSASRVAVGKKVPDIELPATGDQTIRLSQFKGSRLILYFYPKDNTSGCTSEALAFAAYHDAFRRHNAVVLGVSRDSLRSHENFRRKHDLPFPLLADEDERACRMFDVIREKTMYGRKVMGIERSTFLIDEEGVLRREWRKVKVPGHVEEVLAALKAL